MKRLLRKVVGPPANMTWERLWHNFFMIGICEFNHDAHFKHGVLGLDLFDTVLENYCLYDLYVFFAVLPAGDACSCLGTAGKETDRSVNHDLA